MKQFFVKIIYLLVFVATLYLFSASKSLAGMSSPEGKCPKQWSDIVEEVRKKRIKNSSSVSILFVGRDGFVYNCLSDGISDKYFSKIQRLERSKSKVFSSNDEAFPDAMPINFCNVGRSLYEFEEVELLIYLPYEETELSSQICLKILEKSLNSNIR